MKINEFSSEILKEKFTLAELDNGLKIYLLSKPQFDTAFAIFGTKYGSIDTAFAVGNEEMTEVPEGIAHFLEHKLFESEDGDAFTKYAKTGANANAYTSFDRTCYLFSCSNSFYENLAILLDFVQSPYFTKETVDKEQGIIGQEIRMYNDSPDWCVFFNLLKAMYHTNPVKIDIAGTTDSIAQITPELLYKCYNTFYNPANMFVCIAGNFDVEKTLEQIKNSIKPAEPAEITRKVFPEPEKPVQNYIENSLDVSMPIFNYGYKIPVDKEPDLKFAFCVNILLNIIAGDISPLYEKLTDAALINDEFGTEFFNGRGYAAAIFSGESVNPKETARLISEEIKNIRNNGIDERIFEAEKRNVYGSIVKRYNSSESIVSGLTDSAISGYNIFDEIEIIKNLKIEDVENYIGLLTEDQAVLSVINPR